jgi:hypothetical protein
MQGVEQLGHRDRQTFGTGSGDKVVLSLPSKTWAVLLGSRKRLGKAAGTRQVMISARRAIRDFANLRIREIEKSGIR